MLPVSIVAGATVALLIAWLALAAWIAAARLHDDRRHRLRTVDGAQLTAGDDPTVWGVRRLERLADGEPTAGAEEAAHELVRRNLPRLRREAHEDGPRQTHALRVLTRGSAPNVYGVLRSALATGAPEVRAAVVAIAAEQDCSAADSLLLDVLVAGSHPRSRTATELVPRATRLCDDLLALTTHEEPEVRYWALMLLRETASDPRAKAAAVRASTDRAESVRSAAARVLGATRANDITPALRRLLSDEIFFVRSHAARAVAEVGAEQLAGDVAVLLADRSWWVRAAAKESLCALGDSGLDAALTMLDSDDAFARDGAGEVESAFRRTTPRLELAG